MDVYENKTVEVVLILHILFILLVLVYTLWLRVRKLNNHRGEVVN